MTLSEAIRQRQGKRAITVNRDRQERTERRADEIATVAEIETDYQRADRAGDLQIEGHFQVLYQLVDTPAEKDAVARAFAVWQRTERAEEGVVCGSVGDAVDLLKSGNDFWLGAAVPSGSDGAA